MADQVHRLANAPISKCTGKQVVRRSSLWPAGSITTPPSGCGLQFAEAEICLGRDCRRGADRTGFQHNTEST